MITVPAAEDMDAETFCKHVNLRHMPMAGTTSFRVQTQDDGSIRTLRAYHRRIHELEELEHDHKEPKK